MNCQSDDSNGDVSRRSVLAAGATGLALSTGGCIQRVTSVVDQEVTDRLSLTISTVPADGDREAVRIARHLEANLEAVGADVTIDMRSPSEFLETVLLDHDFDLYVGRHPGGVDPDFLYGALRSTYADEAGWQNPFGFRKLDVPLEAQRRATDEAERTAAIESLLEGIATKKPFDPICVPEEHRVARDDFGDWGDGELATRHGFLDLEPAADVDRLRALITDSRPSRNLNPLSATLRDRGTIVDLLYDSLGSERDGEVEPWLAESWEWDDGTIRLTLRENCPFHDDDENEARYVTASDVAFTYEFLQDTSLGRSDQFGSSPAPRYRSRASMVTDVEVLDPYTLRIDVAAGTESVAERALTVPILPKHRWEAQVDSYASSSDEFIPTQGKWGLVTMSNVPPVGSGAFRFESRSERESLTLVPYERHFTRETDGLPAVSEELEELQFGIDPSSASSIERVANNGADVTMSRLESHVLEGKSESSDLEWLESERERMFYHVGFNTRTKPFDDPEVRRVLSRLIDKSWLVDEVFQGNATPVAVPLLDDRVPDELEWNGEDPETPFLGSDGDLDVDAARAAFESAGFRYDDQGRLLV